MKTKIKEKLYLLWLLFWPFQIIWYALLNNNAREMPRFFTVHCFIDDFIPFIPVFVIFYYLWYAYMVAGVAYFAFFEKESYRRLAVFLYTEIMLCLMFCTIFPNGHDFRPAITGQEGFFQYLVSIIYNTDSNCVNIMPSMHVMNAVGITIAAGRSPSLSKFRWLKPVCWIFTVLVALSTVFIKQHSILDVIVAAVICVPVYLMAYKTDFPFFNRNKL